MCFFHDPLSDPITRREAVMRIAALGALPIMPTTSVANPLYPRNAERDFTAITGSTALVGSQLTPLRNAVILLHGNRIEAVGAAGRFAIPDSAYRVHAPGTFTIPGLIDSHVHFFQSGGLYTRPDVLDLRAVRPYTEELRWIKSNFDDTFARYLRAGITSVVDVGGPFWNYDVRALALQTMASPRVMAAGPLISSIDRSILNPDNDPPIVKIDSVEAARALIDRELAARTDFVKFWWIVTSTHPAVAFQPVARAAIDYAHERGARVIVHATELETARLAVESGTDILAHSVFDSDVDEAFIGLLQERNVIYCPTLVVLGNYAATFHGMPNLTAVDLRVANPDVVGTLFNLQDVEGALAPDDLKWIRSRGAPKPPYAAMRNLKRVHDAGIRIAAGTDAGNIGTQHGSSLYEEALEMAASGLTPKQILQTATSGGAEMMGRPHELGAIERYKLADLVVLKEDPLQDVRAIASVQQVIKDGHVFEAASILSERPEQIVQRQVNAYNYHDAEILAEAYRTDAIVTRNGAPTMRSRAAIWSAFRDTFAENPQLHVEIVDRIVDGGIIRDKAHISGFSDGSALDATVTYRVAAGAIERVDISS
jgi:imidazolonepropionase-like amidohydrolase